MKRQGNNRLQEGFSLVEVLIAIVILAVAGGVLLKVLQGTSLTNRSFSNKTLAFVALNKAATQVESSPFIPCTASGGASDFYAKGLPGNVTVKVVEGLVSTPGAANTWVSCSNWGLATPPVVQRVVLQAPYIVNTGYTYDPATGTFTAPVQEDNRKYLFKEIIKTSTGKQSSVQISPDSTSFTLLRVGSSDPLFNTQNKKLLTLGVSPYTCKDVFLWSSASTGGLTVTVNPDCTATVSASRDSVYIPWASSGTVVFSGVDLLNKSQLYQATVNVTIIFPSPTISGFTVTTPTGGNICRTLSAGCPQSGVAGNQVTITGSNLLGNPDNMTKNPVVKFSGNLVASVVSATDSAVVVIVPTGVETGKISLENQKDTAISGLNFNLISKVEFNEEQTWTNLDTLLLESGSFYPFGTSPGSAITISVTGNPYDISYVLFTKAVNDSKLTLTNSLPVADIPAYITSVTGQMVTVVVPKNASLGPLKIQTAAGLSFPSWRDFNPVPNISRVISGVTSSKPFQFDIDDPSISGATVVDYGLQGYGSGITNNNIQITGSGFLGVTSVKFSGPTVSGVKTWINGSNCGYRGANVKGTFFYLDKLDSKKDARIGVCVPSGAVPGRIIAINEVGSGESPRDFHPEPMIQTSSLPTSPKVGDIFTLTGSGFQGISTSSGVTINKVPPKNVSFPSSNQDTSIQIELTCSQQGGALELTSPVGIIQDPPLLSISSSTPMITSYGTNDNGDDKKYLAGGKLTINGSGFKCSIGGSSSPNIKWVSKDSTVTQTLASISVTSTKITATIPSPSPSSSPLAVSGKLNFDTVVSYPTPSPSTYTGYDGILWNLPSLISISAPAVSVSPSPMSKSASATGSSNKSYFTVTDTGGLAIGQLVLGIGIADGSKVTDIDSTSKKITIADNLPANLNSSSVTFQRVWSLKSKSDSEVTVFYPAASQLFAKDQTITLSDFTPNAFNGTGVIQSVSTGTDGSLYSFVVKFLAVNVCGGTTKQCYASSAGNASVSRVATRGSTSITINGTGFYGFNDLSADPSKCPIGLSIYFGLTEISCSALSPSALTDNSITFIMPNSALLSTTGSINVSVSNPNGKSSSSVALWVR